MQLAEDPIRDSQWGHPTLQLHDYLRVLRRHWFLIVASVLVGIACGGGFSALKTPIYESTAKVFVGINGTSNVQELNAGSTFVQQAVASYANLVTTDAVLNPVISKLGLRTTSAALASQVSASNPVNTVVIAITVDDPSSAQAARIANAVASQLSVAVDRITPSAAGSPDAVLVSKVNSAVAASAPASPRIPVSLALGVLVGLVLGLALAFLYDRLDSRIRGQRDIELVTDHPILGGIGYDPRAKTEPLIVRDEPRSTRAESFRSLRTNLQFLDFGSGAQTFVVTSSLENEGKSTTAANLAIAIGDTGQRVLLVEADLRKPKLQEYLGIDGGVGLTDVIIGNARLDEAIQHWGELGMHVLPAGQIPPNPSELLQSTAMSDLLIRLREEFDTVIFDAPPLLPVSDAAILARQASGVLMVAAAGRTTRVQLRAALGALHQVDVKVHGIVLTMIPARGADAYAFGRYGYVTTYGSAAASANHPQQPQPQHV